MRSAWKAPEIIHQGAAPKRWASVSKNPAGAGESEVAVSTPEATPPLAVTASTESVTTSGETITIVLVVEETERALFDKTLARGRRAELGERQG